MKKYQRSRRDFIYLCLGGGGLLAAGYPAAKVISHSGQQISKESLIPTPSNTLGPYYKQGAPRRERLIEPNDAGSPLMVAGRVRSTTGQPLADATHRLAAVEEGVADEDLRLPRHTATLPSRPSRRSRGRTPSPNQ